MFFTIVLLLIQLRPIYAQHNRSCLSYLAGPISYPFVNLSVIRNSDG